MKYHIVHIKPQGYTFAVRAGETVLDAALRQGFQFPHDCQNGMCGTCQGKILEGQVEYDDPRFISLTDTEREEGYALFCSAKPLSDLAIEIQHVFPPSQLPVKTLNYSVESLTNLSKNILHVILKPPAEDHIRYRAGQYIEILHLDTPPKPFSITNAPFGDDHLIELHIRHLPHHTETENLIEEIKKTKQLKLKGPFGNCLLKTEPPFPLILLAGGTGFAPYKALIEKALAENFKQPIYLYWGARTREDLYCHALILQWAKHVPHFHYIPVLSEALPSDHWSGKTGLIHETVLKDFTDLSHFHVYASGPIEMIYAALHKFQEHGMQKHFMYSDTFDFVSKE